MKPSRLQLLSNSRGVIAALAIDQRSSLRKLMADAAGQPVTSISDNQISEFKSVITRVLTPHASAILLDTEYGLAARTARAPQCGLLLAYEMDGYENPRPHRMLALLPELSAIRLAELGADGVKILLSYTPFDDPQANDHKKALIERIGHECQAAGLPFFLEPVSYDPTGGDVHGVEFARRKPEIVIQSMQEFSKERYCVDVLKVEFPVNAAFVEDSPGWCGQTVYTRAEALECFRQADSAARRPYIYLSAGVGINQFVDCLHMAVEAKSRFSGVLCGRATWKGGVKAYTDSGVSGLENWLSDEGVRNITAVNACLDAATPVASF